ncbi:putative ser-Thr-rich glycosyl-phosphatidyl-inositol-anchored membrane family protein [Lyophyllum shimeji]|uniref:Ser-Thr-rich glycosyl-phosphatidyl-inositol-anchored membrane family protein n=1 Tax=Lyophyllum shimeji TaxID=47721 RepID=A0A9P3Q1M4_LYOSH|nr:putative ser-Thr-rich glycosyl-phosphatidyl-inositol-anchored membrane family protein [Lyophyllum shimeji]
MFFSTITVLFAFLLAVTTITSHASPVAEQSLLVWNPRILSPKANMLWLAGSKHTVTWDTTNIPREKIGSTGLILLGYDGTESENLDIEHPLATGFRIDRGSTTVVVPRNLTARDDYFIVLFGDSGNTSPKFKIRKA